MRAILTLISAWIGLPAHGADRPPVLPTYAASPGRAGARAQEGGLESAVGAAAASITNLASLDRADAVSARPRLGVRLAAAAPANPAKPAGPARPAIYGHNVDDVVIGNLHKRPPMGAAAGSGQRGKIVDNGTIRSESNGRVAKPATATGAARPQAATPKPATPPRR